MSTVTKQKPLVPELRFSGFDGEWQKNTFKDLVKINQGLQIAISERMTSPDENSHFYITNEFLRPGNKKKYYIKNPPPSVVCNEDDVLMTRTGNTGKVVTGVSGAFHNNFFKIKYEPSELDKRFLVSFLTLPTTQNRILVMAGTSTIPDLNHTDFYKINISRPEITEQQKIADFLGSVDAWLDNLRQQKTALESYKRGMMQKLFTQQVGFKDDNGKNFPEWKEVKLSQLGKFIGGIGFSESQQGGKDGVSFYKVSDMNLPGNEVEMVTANNYVTEEQIKLNRYKPIKEKALIFAKVGAAIYMERKRIAENFLLDNNMMAFVTTENIWFMYYLSQTVRFSKYAQVGALPSCNGSDIGDIKVEIPTSASEQKKITDFLTVIDQTITAEAEEITRVEQWKKGLMQKMFV